MKTTDEASHWLITKSGSDQDDEQRQYNDKNNLLGLR